MKPMIKRPITSNTRQGIAPWRGIADVFSVVVFFFIFGAAMNQIGFEANMAQASVAGPGSPITLSGVTS
jgi:hypothetical protein